MSDGTLRPETPEQLYDAANNPNSRYSLTSWRYDVSGRPVTSTPSSPSKLPGLDNLRTPSTANPQRQLPPQQPSPPQQAPSQRVPQQAPRQQTPRQPAPGIPNAQQRQNGPVQRAPGIPGNWPRQAGTPQPQGGQPGGQNPQQANKTAASIGCLVVLAAFIVPLIFGAVSFFKGLGDSSSDSSPEETSYSGDFFEAYGFDECRDSLAGNTVYCDPLGFELTLPDNLVEADLGYEEIDDLYLSIAAVHDPAVETEAVVQDGIIDTLNIGLVPAMKLSSETDEEYVAEFLLPQILHTTNTVVSTSPLLFDNGVTGVSVYSTSYGRAQVFYAVFIENTTLVIFEARDTSAGDFRADLDTLVANLTMY